MWFVKGDIGGLFAAGVTPVIIGVGYYGALTQFVLPRYGLGLHSVLLTWCAVLGFLSHCRAVFSNPGTVSMDKRSEPESEAMTNKRICRPCSSIKPANAHHCRKCKRCVVRMDHHCPWINNCVGLRTQKFFILFLFYICIGCVYGLYFLVTYIAVPPPLIGRASLVWFVVCTLILAVFATFTGVMLYEQLHFIFLNTPQIDALKGHWGAKVSRYTALKRVFGESISWRWFVPLSSYPISV